MRLTFTVDAGAIVRPFQIVAQNMADLKPALARMGGRVRSRTKRVFDQEGPGWAPLAKSTLARKPNEHWVGFLAKSKSGRSSDTTVRLAKRIANDRAKADAFQGDPKKATVLVNALRRASENRRSLDTISQAFGFADTDRMILFAEREQRRAKMHGVALRAAKALPKGSEERRRVSRIGQRRYRAEEASTKILGSLRNSMTIKLKGATAEVFAKPKWAGVHNAGGTAGHGAEEPERRFIWIDPSDLPYFEKILLEEALMDL